MLSQEPYQHQLGFMVANLELNIKRLGVLASQAGGDQRRERLLEVCFRMERLRDEIEALDK